MEDKRDLKNNMIDLFFPMLHLLRIMNIYQRVKLSKELRRFSGSVEKVSNWFKHYQVETIELWINGVIETGGITRLVVSAKGEGGEGLTKASKSIIN
jgi:hypothetical protein